MMRFATAFSVFLFGFTFAGPLTSSPSGDWLDSPPKNWNKPGDSLPQAPQEPDWKEILPICRSLRERANSTAEERVVAKKGWLVVGSTDSGGEIIVVIGTADLDGMCRPGLYQDFVFFNGKFVGTLSPVPMTSRADGASGKISFPGGRKVIVDFKRYTDRDPLYCASLESEATYEIRSQAGGWVVLLTGVQTRRA